MRKIEILIPLALYSKKGEAWSLGRVVQQSWQALALAVPKLEVGESEEYSRKVWLCTCQGLLLLARNQLLVIRGWSLD